MRPSSFAGDDEAMSWKRRGEKGCGFMKCSVVSIICDETAVNGRRRSAYMGDWLKTEAVKSERCK